MTTIPAVTTPTGVPAPPVGADGPGADLPAVDLTGPLPTGTTVLPALVYIAAETLEPGHILHRAGTRLTVPGCPTTATAL